MRNDVAGRKVGIKLGRHHFALFRGSLDGLEMDVLGDRLLETGDDVRAAKKTLDWVRSELMAAAGRYQQETGVTGSSFRRLIRTPLKNVTPDERETLSNTPSLEEFQDEYDPSGFYSESELIEAFQDRYGKGQSGTALRKAEQNDRLRRKIRHAIDTLENWLATTPKPTDPIEIWIDPVVADPLVDVGIETIEQLVEVINKRGNLWHRKVAKFGPVRAKRVIRWLQLNQVLPIDNAALVPYREIAPLLPGRREAEFAVVPIEHLKLPSELDGSLGSNRGADSQLAATNDLQAIYAWLNIKGDNNHTRRAYQAQAERFLLWLTFEKGRALSSASPEDCHEYIIFLEALANPGSDWSWRLTRPHWVGDKSAKRWSKEWKPFTGEMSDSTRRMAVTILKGLFTWLVQVGYLRRDPWATVKTPRMAGRRIKVDHALNKRQWSAVIAALEEKSAFSEDVTGNEPYLRLRLILWLGYSCGQRQEELLRLRVKNLRRTPDETWEIVFIGKGSKEREVPLAPRVMGYLMEYMAARGHGHNPVLWDKNLPLLTALGPDHQHVQKRKDKPLAARSLSQLIKRHFDDAADRVDDIIDEHLLRQASTHWLRHTAATNMINKGAAVAVVQEILGHADSATTALYTHADRKLKREAVESLIE